MSRRWIDPQDFRDLRRESGLTRREAAKELDVTAHHPELGNGRRSHPLDGLPDVAHPARLRSARPVLGRLDGLR